MTGEGMEGTESRVLRTLDQNGEATLSAITHELEPKATIGDVFLACRTLQRRREVVRTKPATYELTDRGRTALKTARDDESTEHPDSDETGFIWNDP